MSMQQPGYPPYAVMAKPWQVSCWVWSGWA